MLGKDSTQIFCCFFVALVTTILGWIPSEASLQPLGWTDVSAASAAPPLSAQLALAFLQRSSKKVLGPKVSVPTGHARWKEDEDGANKRWHRKRIGGDIAMGTAARGAAVLWKGSRAFDCRAFLIVDGVSTLLCLWRNAGKTHNVHIDIKPLASTVFFFFFVDQYKLTAAPCWDDLGQLV